MESIINWFSELVLIGLGRLLQSLFNDMRNTLAYLCLPSLTINRNMRNEPLQQIATEFNRRKLTHLTPEDIRKKIHGIRTRYLAEVQKFKKNEASEASTDEIYKPKLWCFDLLQFLQQGMSVVSKGESNMITHCQEQEQDRELESEVLYDGEIDNICDVEVEILIIHLPSSSKAESCAPSRSDGEHGPNKKKRKCTDKENISGLLNTAVATLQTLSEGPGQQTPQQRTHNLFGEYVIKSQMVKHR